MESRPWMAKPQPASAIAAQAENFSFNTNIPFKHWARAAETLQQEASFARSDGDYGRAYLMLYRHSLLVLKCLPTHPQFKDPESRRAFRPLSKRIESVLSDLERIKPYLDAEYAEWERISSELASAQRSRSPAPSTYAEYASRDVSLAGHATVLDAYKNQELAVELAQKELARRDEARRVSRNTAVPDDEAHSTLGQPHASSSWHDDTDLQTQMQAARRAMPFDQQDRHQNGSRERTVSVTNFSYPSIAKTRPLKMDDSYSLQRHGELPTAGPTRPPKERLPSIDPAVGAGYFTSGSQSPVVPRKVHLDEDAPPIATRPPAISDPSPVATEYPPRPPKTSLAPAGPPLPKKERLAFKPGAYLENGDPIRPVFLPSKLRSAFLKIASNNTRKGLEMCGILCGTPVNNALFVRCLVIPDQKCTSDTCETENEGTMFDYCASEDLLVLGWIHTHPTQTCFMSSRDLHTQAGYQVMMPESIAVVCAPKFKPDYGIFRLTHPPGLDHILDCKNGDTFHQHSITNIYRDTEQPHGHVYESDKLPFYVHDLRTK